MKPKFTLLFAAAATEFASGGGASVSTPEAPAAETPAAETAAETPESAPAAAADAKPTLLQKLHASVQSKAVLLSENATFQSENSLLLMRAETAEASLIAAHADISARDATILDQATQLAAIHAALDTALATATSTEAAAAAQVAAFGFQAADLPESAKAGDTREELEAQLSRETDNDKRYALSMRIWEMA